MKTLLKVKNPVTVFENLSIALTGFTKAEIINSGQLEIYYNLAISELGKEPFNDLLLAFKYYTIKNPNFSADKIVNELQSSDFYKTTTLQLKQLWYFGMWFEMKNEHKVIAPNTSLQNRNTPFLNSGVA
jgi:hypothetical protein